MHWARAIVGVLSNGLKLGVLFLRVTNRGRCHSALGPGVPDPSQEAAMFPRSESRHRLAAGSLVLAKSVLGGLHHEYS
ncbi:MAG: hypothetical protein OEQ39_29175, partial [Gammaproteobacteria bacterium]|nr:hypothetical protein [Gammaproteobacteria bacterium]